MLNLPANSIESLVEAGRNQRVLRVYLKKTPVIAATEYYNAGANPGLKAEKRQH
ncbi:hypothetical protein BN133_898 [Cronobacter dublinensis 582]|nr:hypothetical protein BN133_898 [Cronobacter dublinensis 582]